MITRDAYQENRTAYRLSQLATTKDKPGILPVSPATIWRWVKDGKFPKPFTMGMRCTAWNKSAVDTWLAEAQVAERNPQPNPKKARPQAAARQPQIEG